MNKKILSSVCILLVFVFFNSAEAQEWTVGLIFAEDSVVKDSLQFGIHTDGTDGIDNALGESELPPKPVSGVFDVRFTGTNLGNGLKIDIRENTTDQKEFVIDIQREAGGEITISWGQLPSGDFVLQDMFGGVLGIDVDMTTANETTITNAAITRVKLLVTPSFAAVNTAPELTTIGNKTVDEGVNLNFTVTATDADADSMFYSAENLPTGSTFDNTTATFDWTPGYDQAGSYSVTFIVTDNGTPAKADSETVTITVSDVNRAPVLETIGDKTVEEGENLNFTVTATDADADSMFYTAENLPTGSTFDNTTATFDWTPGYNQAGSYSVTFIVIDNGTPAKADSETVTITVSELSVSPDINTEITFINDTSGVFLTFSNNTSIHIKLVSGAFTDHIINIAQLSDIPDSLSGVPGFTSPAYYYYLSIDMSAFTVDLTFKYAESKLTSLGIDEDNLAVCFYDSTDDRGYMWHSIPVNIDKDENTIKVTTDHFSLWSITSTEEDLISGVDNAGTPVPEEYKLDQNFPNPFNPETTIKYQLKGPSNVVLKVYNMLGQEIRTLVNTRKPAGYHQIIWDGRNDNGIRVNSGVYLYRLQAGDFIEVKKMVLLK